MKKLILLLVAITTFGCETTSTVITGSWKSPKQTKAYSNLLIAALTSHAIAKSTIETELAAAFAASGVKAVKSIDEFPPNLAVSDSDKQVLMGKMKSIGSDAVLTVSLLRKETESRYTPGSIAYDPYSFGYYRQFWGYYSYWYPDVYEPGYYTTEQTYYMETNLYDAVTEDLVWSAQSETYNPADLSTFAVEFANTIISQLKADHVIATSSSSSR